MNHDVRRILPAPLLVLVLVACNGGDAQAIADQGGTQRIINEELANARSPSGDKGIDLEVNGKAIHASTAMQTGYRSSGEGDLMLSVEAARIEGQELLKAKVVVHQLQPSPGTQAVGNGNDNRPWIELEGVPGQGEATLRSMGGKLDIASLPLSEYGLPSAGDLAFEGSFAPTVGDDGSVDASTTLEISGRVRFKND